MNPNETDVREFEDDDFSLLEKVLIDLFTATAVIVAIPVLLTAISINRLKKR